MTIDHRALRPGRAMRFARGLLAAGLLVGPIVMPTAASAEPETATTDTSAPGSAVTIDIKSVSPWVPAEGVWTTQFTVAEAPADAVVTYSVRQPTIGTEAELHSRVLGDNPTSDNSSPLRAPVAASLASLTDTAGVTTLSVPVRSRTSTTDNRVFLPNAGSHPVIITVSAADGALLASTGLYLNHVPSETDRPVDSFKLALLVQPTSAIGFDNDGAVDVPESVRTSYRTATNLLRLGSGLDLTTALDPQALDALESSSLGVDNEVANELREQTAERTTLRSTWSSLDMEAWSTGGRLADVQTSLLVGERVLLDTLGSDVDPITWPADSTVGSSGVALLRRIGVDNLVVSEDQFDTSKLPDRESGSTRPIRVLGEGDNRIRAMALSTARQQLLADRDANPALAAHIVLTELFGAWLSDGTARGAIIRLDNSTNPSTASALFDALRKPTGATQPNDEPVEDPNVIGVVGVTEVIGTLPLIGDGENEPRFAVPLNPPTSTAQIASIADLLATTEAPMRDYAAMMPVGDPEVDRRALLLRRSLDRRIAPGVQEDILRDLETRLDDDLHAVSTTESRSLTVTARRTSIPLRFANSLPQPLTVRLRLQSPRLHFVDGADQTLVLQPGVNRIDVDVDVQASGQFVMRADVLSPVSDRILATSKQRIRSTTFSGVGLMLSGGALLFLVAWWLRTARRRGRTDTER